MDDQLSISNHKDYISNLELDIKDKMALINFINSIKSEVVNNLSSKIEEDKSAVEKLLPVFFEKKDLKNIKSLIEEELFYKQMLEYFNNQIKK